MQLYIGNKNYSSWSMRPWVLMRHFALPFTEVMVRFDSFEPGSRFKQTLAALGAPTGKVPLLVDDFSAVFFNKARTINAGICIVISFALFWFIQKTVRASHTPC